MKPIYSLASPEDGTHRVSPTHREELVGMRYDLDLFMCANAIMDLSETWSRLPAKARRLGATLLL